jgi:soluble P-type ATPase
MTLRYEIPGSRAIELEHLLLDVNGTLTDRGELLPGVAERLARLRSELVVHLLSADTFGNLDELGRGLGVGTKRISTGRAKASVVSELGADGCAAIGNGRNDAEMLRAVRLGIAVLGPEGASSEALRAADVACSSILVALDLLLDPLALAATLRP